MGPTMATRLDPSLSSNAFTAFAPRPDMALGHGAKYWLQQVEQSVKDLFRGARADTHPPRGVPPGSLQPINGSAAGPAGSAVLRTLCCAETGQIHEQLPVDQAEAISDYFDLAQLSYSPESTKSLGAGEAGAQRLQDAFRTHVSVTAPDGSARRLAVLPDSLLQSDLLNRRLGAPSRGVLPPALRDQTGQMAKGWAHGQVQSLCPNTLYDPLTGFSASISVRNGNEVVIAFSGMGSQGGSVAQGIRGFMNALGLTPPKNMAQASKLTQMVKAHLDQVNAQLPAGQQLKLKLAGFSMGGGLASYAALRNDVPAVALSPMRLGLLTRAKCGRDAIKNAPKLITEVTVQSDWVADNGKTRALKALSLPSYLLTGRRADPLGAIGHRYIIPKPGEVARVFEAAEQNWSEKDMDSRQDVHTEFKLCLEIHRKALLKAEEKSST
jgi:hypothetical protein